jgi:riboflavin biosynthesis pyrimidine reductase
VATRQPWVVLLQAADPESKVDPALQTHRHKLRMSADAVCTDACSLVGLGLRLRDPWPQPVPAHRVLRKVLLDPTGYVDSGHPFWRSSSHQPAVRALAFPRKAIPGVQDCVCGNGHGSLDIPGLLGFLGRLGVVRLLVEGDRTLMNAFQEKGWADEIAGASGASPASSAVFAGVSS